MRHSDHKDGSGTRAKTNSKSEELQRQMQALTARDLHLWSITIVVFLVLGLGFAALVAPSLVGKTERTWGGTAYLPQLFFGLISLIVLFNIYVIAQRRELNTTRQFLVKELVFSERLESLSLVDPLTQLYNRRAMEEIVAREAARANRHGSSLTLLLLDLDDFKSLNARLGSEAGDQLLVETAQLLKSTFRGSDMVFRYGGDEFFVIMPDTNEQQAECALRRLTSEIEKWNIESRMEWEMALTWGLVAYVTGARTLDMLHAAERKVLLKKNKLVPVFRDPVLLPLGKDEAGTPGGKTHQRQVSTL